jgi:hypothetical protein
VRKLLGRPLLPRPAPPTNLVVQSLRLGTPPIGRLDRGDRPKAKFLANDSTSQIDVKRILLSAAVASRRPVAPKALTIRARKANTPISRVTATTWVRKRRLTDGSPAIWRAGPPRCPQARLRRKIFPIEARGRRFGRFESACPFLKALFRFCSNKPLSVATVRRRTVAEVWLRVDSLPHGFAFVRAPGKSVPVP